ncbi:hypothetical protein ACIA4B_09530 [Lactobacillus delbrueckii subsp. bulgaricus]
MKNNRLMKNLGKAAVVATLLTTSVSPVLAATENKTEVKSNKTAAESSSKKTSSSESSKASSSSEASKSSSSAASSSSKKAAEKSTKKAAKKSTKKAAKDTKKSTKKAAKDTKKAAKTTKKLGYVLKYACRREVKTNGNQKDSRISFISRCYYGSRFGPVV